MLEFYKKKQCPICGGKMIFTDDPPDVDCENGCCELIVDYGENKVYGITFWFDGDGNDDNSFCGLPEDLDKALKRIEYWKKDDRYLLYIISR